LCGLYVPSIYEAGWPECGQRSVALTSYTSNWTARLGAYVLSDVRTHHGYYERCALLTAACRELMYA
jgi:hypothetical protein